MSSTSASSTARWACGWKPLSPMTPNANSCSSGTIPWPEIVVTTGACRRSANASTAAPASEWFAPPPATITGRSAAFRYLSSANKASLLPRVR